MHRSENISCGIVDLPVELILHIFKFLDNRSQVSVSAVCRSWKYLTENCLKWSLHLNPTFDDSICSELIRVGVGSRRQFTNIHLKGDVRVPIILEFFLKLDHAFACTVTDITISNAKFQLLEFNNFLTKFPNLKNLDVSSVKLLTGDRSVLQLNDDNKPLCEHLKKLSFCDATDNGLLQCLTKSKLTTLICRQQQFTREAVLKFFSTQNQLREIDLCRLALYTAVKFDVFGNLTSAVMPTLRNVALDYKLVSDFNGIVTLLLNQASNIKTIELGHIPIIQVLTIIFENLNNLKTLHLIPGSVKYDVSNKLILQPLPSVTSLRLYDGATYGMNSTSMEKMTNKIIKNLPNLEDLELFVPYKQSHFQSIISNLKNLKSLTIRVNFQTNLNDLKFPPVEKLRINYFSYGSNRQMDPPISMAVEGEAKEINEAVRSLTYEGIADENFFVFIRNTFPKLELLDVPKDLARIREPIVGIRCIRYREASFFVQPIRFDFSSFSFAKSLYLR